jgi:hypothetical protein
MRLVLLTLAWVAIACGNSSRASLDGGPSGSSADGGRGGAATSGGESGARTDMSVSGRAGASSGSSGKGGAGGTSSGGTSGESSTGGSSLGGRDNTSGAPAFGGGGAGIGGSGTGAGLGGGGATGGTAGASGGSGTPGAIRYVFVIPMENHDEGEVVGNAKDAPYINGTLLPAYASTSNFVDQFAISTPSEPHYVWMEAGTNMFADHTFTNDDVPSATNSTADTAHLVTQIAKATNGVSWRSYQQGLSDATGACPIAASGHYVPRHDPFVFFQDVAGNPPSKTNAACAQHHSAIEALSADLMNGSVATYDFVTPDLCNDMHGQSGCPDSNLVHAGDAWLAATLPALISFVNEHAGVVFIVWDEGDSTTKIPFVAVGPGVKPGYTGALKYTHGSLLKSVEEILGLPVVPSVASENDFADLFAPGQFP